MHVRQHFTVLQSATASFPLWRRRRRRRWTVQVATWLLALALLGLPARIWASILTESHQMTLRPSPQLEPTLLVTVASSRRRNGQQDRTEEEENMEGALVGLEPEVEKDGRTSTGHPQQKTPLLSRPVSPRRQQQPFLLDDGPPTEAFISSKSWADYQRFKEETCRKGTAEESLAERSLNNTESGYFQWEQNEFHRQLRGRLLPQTRSGNFHSLVGTPLLSHLDPRLFVSEPRTLCKAKRHISESDERQKLAKEEQHLFEDFLINKDCLLTPKLTLQSSQLKISRRKVSSLPLLYNVTNNSSLPSIGQREFSRQPSEPSVFGGLNTPKSVPHSSSSANGSTTSTKWPIRLSS